MYEIVRVPRKENIIFGKAVLKSWYRQAGMAFDGTGVGLIVTDRVCVCVGEQGQSLSDQHDK